MAVENILSVASITENTIQGQITLVSCQNEALDKLVSELIENFRV